MRKRKAILAMLLTASMAAGTISPAFAGELTDDSLSSYEESEEVLVQDVTGIPEEICRKRRKRTQMLFRKQMQRF